MYIGRLGGHRARRQQEHIARREGYLMTLSGEPICH
jgi:hypothetical protein